MQTDQLTRPVALVTGASSGIGAAIARALAHSHHVIGVGRNADRLAAFVQDTQGEAWAAELSDNNLEPLIERIHALPRLDVLVHAAAHARVCSVADAHAQDWAQSFAVNVTAPALLTRAALPLLRASTGTVVFIGSGASTKPVPGSAVYTATKHALRAVADVLRTDEEHHHVRVATVAPGPTLTPMLRSMTPEHDFRPERYIQPQDIADTVAFLVNAPANLQITNVEVRPRQEIRRL